MATVGTNEWDGYAAAWDEDQAARSYAQEAFRTLATSLTENGLDLEGAHVLDLGCGTGLLTERLAAAGATVVAVDGSPAMIERLETKSLPGVSAVCATLDGSMKGATWLVEQPFDVAVASSVFAFLEDYPAVAALVAARLNPGALLLQWDWELEPSAEEPFGLSREAVRAALEGAGLEVLTLDTGFEVPIGDLTMAPLMAVGRRPATEDDRP